MKNAIKHVRLGVIAVEEEVVAMPVRIGVHENGAARSAIASSAADFLIVRFDAAG